MNAARDHFDQALVKDLALYRSNDGAGNEWWTARRGETRAVDTRQGDGAPAGLLASWHRTSHKPKERVFQFFGVNVDMHVTSLQEHFTLAVECWVRTVAVNTALLSPLFCENDLALLGRFATQAKVHKILVEASSAARAAAESYGLDASSQNCANVLQKKSPFLLSQDKHFHIEMRFWKDVSWKTVRRP